jgi:hypothetical protein
MLSNSFGCIVYCYGPNQISNLALGRLQHDAVFTRGVLRATGNFKTDRRVWVSKCSSMTVSASMLMNGDVEEMPEGGKSVQPLARNVYANFLAGRSKAKPPSTVHRSYPKDAALVAAGSTKQRTPATWLCQSPPE